MRLSYELKSSPGMPWRRFKPKAFEVCSIPTVRNKLTTAHIWCTDKSRHMLTDRIPMELSHQYCKWVVPCFEKTNNDTASKGGSVQNGGTVNWRHGAVVRGIIKIYLWKTRSVIRVIPCSKPWPEQFFSGRKGYYSAPQNDYAPVWQHGTINMQR